MAKTTTASSEAKQTPPPDATPYEPAPPGMKDQDWRNLVGLLQTRMKEQEAIMHTLKGGRTAALMEGLEDRVQAQAAKIVTLETTIKIQAEHLAALKAQMHKVPDLEKVVKEHTAQLAALKPQDNSTKGA